MKRSSRWTHLGRRGARVGGGMLSLSLSLSLSLFAQGRPTVALLDGPPVVVKGKTGLMRRGEAPCLDSRAWEEAETSWRW
jgi:hypothetical protein